MTTLIHSDYFSILIIKYIAIALFCTNKDRIIKSNQIKKFKKIKVKFDLTLKTVALIESYSMNDILGYYLI